jgi:cytochrome c6
MRLRIAALAILTGLTTSLAGAQNTAPADYKAKCAMCHAADGTGNTPAGKSMKAVSFSDPSVKMLSDAQLEAITKDGKGKMPAYKGKLTDAQIHDLIAYVRTLSK